MIPPIKSLLNYLDYGPDLLWSRIKSEVDLTLYKLGFLTQKNNNVPVLNEPENYSTDPIVDFYFYPYFYINDPQQLFVSKCEWEDSIPIRSKGSSEKYNPLLSYYYGLTLMNQDLTEAGNSSLETCLNLSDYWVSKAKKIGDRRYLFSYEENFRDRKAKSTSGITQAIATSFYIRLHHITDDPEFLKLAEEFFNPCLDDDDDGVKLTHEGYVWVEEYKTSKPSLVLNGFLFSIVAAIELSKQTGQKVYKEYSLELLKSLEHFLPRYQYGRHLRYDMYELKFGNINYQALLPGLFLQLYKLTENNQFKELFLFYARHCDWNQAFRFFKGRVPSNFSIADFVK